MWPDIVNREFLVKRKRALLDIAFGKAEWEITGDLEEADVVLQECSNISVFPGKKNIVICGESDARCGYCSTMEDAIKFGYDIKFIGAVEDSEISFNVPLQNHRVDIPLEDHIYVFPDKYVPPSPSFGERLRKVCFMRKNTNCEFRENFAKILNVDYVNGGDKYKILSNYLFNFCSENALSRFNGNEGHITEKIYDAVAAHCIPVYFGGNIAKYTVLNPERVLCISHKQSILDILQFVNNAPIEDVRSFFDLPLYRPDAESFIEQRETMFKEFMSR